MQSVAVGSPGEVLPVPMEPDGQGRFDFERIQRGLSATDEPGRRLRTG